MKREELKNWILSEFEAVECELLEEQRAEVFRVDLAVLAEIARVRLADSAGDLGDFEAETLNKRLNKFENSDESRPIFAVLDLSEYPVSIEVKTGVALAKLLREKESVVPSKLLSESEWSRIIGFGQVSETEVEDLLKLSYRLATEE